MPFIAHNKKACVLRLSLIWIVLMAFGAQASGAGETVTVYKKGDPNAAHGFGVGIEAVRKENDDVIAIPLGKADDVYNYIKDKYYNHTNFLKAQYPDLHLTAKIEDDSFSDDYFDTPNLDLFAKENSLRHRTRIDLGNSLDPKNGRELVQLKLSHDVHNAEVRDEYKFAVQPHPTNFYKKRVRNLDAVHPLIAVIPPKQRTQFEQEVLKLDIDPYRLRSIFTLTQHRRRVYIYWDDVFIVSLSVDEANVNRLWTHISFSGMEQQLNEIPYTQGDDASKQKMIEIRKTIIDDLKANKPYVTVNQTPKYVEGFDLLEQHMPFLRTLIRWNIL